MKIILIEAIYIMLCILLAKYYLLTVAFSSIMIILGRINESRRANELGFILKRFKFPILERVLELSIPFIPLLNFIFSSYTYLKSYCSKDMDFLEKNNNALIPIEDIKEKNISYYQETFNNKENELMIKRINKSDI